MDRRCNSSHHYGRRYRIASMTVGYQCDVLYSYWRLGRKSHHHESSMLLLQEVMLLQTILLRQKELLRWKVMRYR
jgi:hypothetical protein